MNILINRRAMLQASGGLVVTFTLPCLWAGAQATAQTKSVSIDRVDAFLAVSPDGKVTVYSGKVDLGTGVRTALTQIVAEELDVPIGQIAVIEGDTALACSAMFLRSQFGMASLLMGADNKHRSAVSSTGRHWRSKSTMRHRPSRPKTTPWSANLCSVSTFPTRSLAASLLSRTSSCPACCTAALFGLRASAAR